MRHDDDSTIEDHDRGLSYDLPRLMSRRRAVGLLAGGIGTVVLAACGSSGKDAAGTTGGGPSSEGATAGGATEIPDETAGPFPGDGSNGPNILAESGVVRRDITRSFGAASGVAEGVPATIAMTLLDVAGGGTPLAGAAVYLWHCDIDGRYSMYDQGVAGENYLRGVQESDADGKVAFASIFPAAYVGRWPHIHFEVYESLDAATSAGSKLKTSQIALPAEACELVYATRGYERSAEGLDRTSLETDNVFSDGYAGQLATVSGTVERGFTIELNVGV
jgi:protocatechuate 3,4-dioxygenase beta subunit